MVYRHREYKASDDVRETPNDFFKQQDAIHRFTIDACALGTNTKCRLFYAPDGLYRLDLDPSAELLRGGCNGLTGRYDRQRVWCNPPFSGFDEWLPWAWAHSEAESITMIAPATRTDRPWWQKWVEPYRDNQPERRQLGEYQPDEFLHPAWRLTTDYTPDRIDFLEDGHPIWRRHKGTGDLVLKKSGPNKGKPTESTAMFGLVIMNWSHV